MRALIVIGALAAAAGLTACGSDGTNTAAEQYLEIANPWTTEISAINDDVTTAGAEGDISEVAELLRTYSDGAREYATELRMIEMPDEVSGFQSAAVSAWLACAAGGGSAAKMLAAASSIGHVDRGRVQQAVAACDKANMSDNRLAQELGIKLVDEPDG